MGVVDVCVSVAGGAVGVEGGDVEVGIGVVVGGDVVVAEGVGGDDVDERDGSGAVPSEEDC